MNAREATHLCKLAKTISPAQAVDEFTPAAWALILEDIRFEDARLALKQLGGEQEWVHVSHIVQRVKRIRRDRVLDFGTLPDPPRRIDPDGPEYRHWLAETTKAIADGTYRPSTPEALGAKRDIRELGTVRTVDAALATRPLREAHADARRALQEADADRKRQQRERHAEIERMRAADRAARANEGDRMTTTTRDADRAAQTEEASA